MRRLFLSVAALVLLLFCAAPSVTLAEDSGGDLFKGYEYFSEADGENGPWVYESENITITITRDIYKQSRYACADIILRGGELFYPAGAYGKIGTFSVEMPTNMARRYSAVFAFTGDYLHARENRKGVMIRDGVVYYENTDMDVVAFLPDGSMRVYVAGTVTSKELLALGVKNSYAFGPALIKDYQPCASAYSHKTSPNNRRCAIGMIEPNHYIVMTSTSGFDMRKLISFFADKGCSQAYNMDGGHSASMIIMGEQLNAQPYESSLKVFQRAIPDMIMLGKSTLVPKIEDPIKYTHTTVGKAIQPQSTAAPVATDAPTPTAAPTSQPN